MSYGVDIWCTDRIQTGRYASGRRLLAQAIVRRLETPPGALEFLVDEDESGDEHRAYGVGLSDYVGAPDPEAVAASLPEIIRSQLLEDERLADVDVSVAVDGDVEPALRVSIDVRPADEDDPFTLVLSVSEAAVLLTAAERL